ncbi:MAG: DUF6573 family protein, partial [Polyangiaceae bacterium]
MDDQLNPLDDDFELISRYSRAQALEDGVLVDVSDAARETGLRFPVALTHAAWTLCVSMTPAAETAGCDERGRLHDVLYMLLCAIRRSRTGREVSFEVLCVTTRLRPTCVPLRAVAGAGDDLEPVIT